MQVTLILFGQLVDITNCTSLSVEDICDTNSLTQYLQQHYPAFISAKYAIAVDKKIVRENTPLNNGTTVALLPPFSGG